MDTYKTDKRKTQDAYKKEQQDMSDKLIKQTFQLEEAVNNQQNQERTSINRQFDNGSWFTMTNTQKSRALAQAGLGLEEGRAMENSMFSKSITQEVASAVWSNVTLTGDDRSAIQELSKSYMEGGLVFAEANKRATLDYIESSPRLKKVKQVQDAKLNKALAPKGSWAAKWKPWTKINAAWQFTSVDPVTLTSRLIRDEQWLPTKAQIKGKSAEEEKLDKVLNFLTPSEPKLDANGNVIPE